MGVGGLVGVVSGLLGIGGGVLIVPFLYLLMAGGGWSGLEVSAHHQAQFAHATSLALIIPTALSGLASYGRKGLVSWNAVFSLGAAAAVAAFLGARVAVFLPSVLLKAAFGVFLLTMAWRIGATGTPAPGGGAVPGGADEGIALGQGASAAAEGASARGERTLRWPAAMGGGGVVGFLSALLGVGGGVVAIPILVRWAGMDLHRVAAASLGIIAFAALAGTAGYALAGRGAGGLPPGSLGFVHLPLLVAMLPGAILMAPLGARLNQALPTAALRQVFALLLLVMGLQLLWANGAELARALA